MTGSCVSFQLNCREHAFLSVIKSGAELGLNLSANGAGAFKVSSNALVPNLPIGNANVCESPIRATLIAIAVSEVASVVEAASLPLRSLWKAAGSRFYYGPAPKPRKLWSSAWRTLPSTVCESEIRGQVRSQSGDWERARKCAHGPDPKRQRRCAIPAQVGAQRRPGLWQCYVSGLKARPIARRGQWSGLSALFHLSRNSYGVAIGWYGAAPLALNLQLALAHRC